MKALQKPTDPAPSAGPGLMTFAAVIVLLGMAVWYFRNADSKQAPHLPPPAESGSPIPPEPPSTPVPGDALLAGYGDPATPPADDLRKIHRVTMGYFSVIKDASRFPIGGNADLAAALRGENVNRQVFIRRGHPVFSDDGELTDRWGVKLVIHPEAHRELEIRSAGPDGIPYNGDDIILGPDGLARDGGGGF
jgi:hypothetical protein